MRLFTGIGLPQSLIEELTRLIERLRPAAHLKWSAAYNFHITTKFIGEWPQERLEQVTEALRPLAHRSPIDIAVSGIGWFPNARSPKVLFVGIQAGAELELLARNTNDTLHALGIAPETRRFAPHLTLARLKDPAVPLDLLKRTIDNLVSVEMGTFTSHSFHLYLSKPGPAGSIYTRIAEFPFLQQ